MSLRGVAQEAGVGVGTLYRHFPTRRDLLDAVLEDVVARTGGSCRPSSTGWAGTGTAVGPRRGGGGSRRTWGP